MSAHLLLVTLGPVQEFIAQARRTRDLWFGSHLLGELSRAAARALVEAGAELVFPPLDAGDPELEPCDGPLRRDGRPPLAVPNKLLAVVPDGADPEAAARAARALAGERRSALAGAVQRKCKGLLAEGIDAVWKEQIDTFLEFQAAWLSLESIHGDYNEIRRDLENAVAARKHLRDFPVWTRQRGNVPKSSLDGARETVLAPPSRRAAHLVRRYRIAEGEQLDAVGLVKRAGGEPEQFVPVPNVALAAWIEQAARVAAPAMDRLAGECAVLGIGRIDRRDLRWTQRFPFDAEVFLDDRRRSVADVAQCDPQALKDLVQPILNEMSAPYPYVACIAADGDRMGDALRRLGARDQQRSFARELSRFAEKARDVVERQRRGVLVYAGGDDVLAFVCLDDALECAEALRRAFEDVMTQALSVMKAAAPIEPPTLSIGVGVGHVMESMGHLLDLGRKAEERAKNASPGEGDGRNALAIAIEKRAGSAVIWRARWDAPEGPPVARIARDIALLGDRLSSKKVFEIQTDVARMPAPEDLLKSEDASWAELLAADARRTLARASEGAGVLPAEAGLDLDPHAGYGPLRRRIDRWIARMLVARAFGEARRAREPRQRRA